jgi:hypothetical protein
MEDSRPETRECPFCKEEIKADAIKCKHCDSMVALERPTHGGICPYCKEEIKPDAIKCKHCQSILGPDATGWPFAEGGSWTGDRPFPFQASVEAVFAQAMASRGPVGPGDQPGPGDIIVLPRCKRWECIDVWVCDFGRWPPRCTPARLCWCAEWESAFSA